MPRTLIYDAAKGWTSVSAELHPANTPEDGSSVGQEMDLQPQRVPFEVHGSNGEAEVPEQKWWTDPGGQLLSAQPGTAGVDYVPPAAAEGPTPNLGVQQQVHSKLVNSKLYLSGGDRHVFTWGEAERRLCQRVQGPREKRPQTLNGATGARLLELFRQSQEEKVDIRPEVISGIAITAQDIASRVQWQMHAQANPPLGKSVDGADVGIPVPAGSFADGAGRPEPSLDEVAATIAGEGIHRLSLTELAACLETDVEDGLAPEEHARRLAADGPNRLTPPKERHWILVLITHIISGFALLMYFCALGSFVMYIFSPQMTNIYVGIILIAVPVATGIFTYLQTIQAKALMKRFSGLTSTQARVVRGGKELLVDSSDLVVGDVVLVSAGSRVPADLVVVASVGLKVNNSTLTGEGEALSRTVGCTHPSVMESKNVMFCGTYVAEGAGQGVVFKTGDRMIIGQVAHCSMHNTKPKAHLKGEMQLFVWVMLGISVGLAVFFIVIAFGVWKYPWETSLLMTIGILVGNMPTGLLPQVAAQLYITAKMMASLNVMVKDLEVIETLGCVTVIASDKTGTLTQNKMTVSHVQYDGRINSAGAMEEDGTYPPVDAEDPSFGLMQSIATLCSFASLADDDQTGNPTEKAIVKYFSQFVDIEAYRAANPKLGEIAFNSNNKWMLTVCDGGPAGVCLYLKGAPERVMQRCRTALMNGAERPLAEVRERIEQHNVELGGHGERVLGMAFQRLDPVRYPASYAFDMDHMNFPMDDFCFVGLVSLIDPPRPEVPDAIAMCQGAGIRVMMVTGDQPVTAEAIARQIGILRPAKVLGDTTQTDSQTDDYSEVIVHGDQLHGFTDEDWDRVLACKGIVFARTLPQQKQAIVVRLQGRGETVAVTGDGVNDSPALKQACCGIAMGSAGSEIAKDAADVVLMDDNFSSIVKGIQQGRLVFCNLQNCIVYVLTHVVNEFMPVVVYVCLQLPVAVTTQMMLSMDLGTDMLPAIALAFEGPENSIMKHPPRRRTERLTGWRLFFTGYLVLGMFECFMGYIIYAYVFGDAGFPIGSLFWTSNWFSSATADMSDADRATSNAMMMANSVYQSQKAQWASWDDYRNNAQAMAMTGFTTSVFIAQMGHLFTCRTKYASIFRTKCNNWRLFPSIAFSLGLNLIMVYTPVGSIVFGCASIDPKYYGYSMFLPFAMMTLQEVRKFCIRRWPKGVVAFLTDY